MEEKTEAEEEERRRGGEERKFIIIIRKVSFVSCIVRVLYVVKRNLTRRPNETHDLIRVWREAFRGLPDLVGASEREREREREREIKYTMAQSPAVSYFFLNLSSGLDRL